MMNGELYRPPGASAPVRSRFTLPFFLIILTFVCVCMIHRATAAEADGMLQLFDGSHLHGQLRQVDPRGVIRWKHPDVAREIQFSPANLYLIQFQHAVTPAPGKAPNCRFRFTNNDEVWGQLLSLDEQKVELETWFAGKLSAPRDAIRSLTFLNPANTVLYEGPTSMEGWILGAGTGAWGYRDGMLVARSVGSIGRAANLPAMARIEFELEWSAQPSMILSLFTDAIDRFDFGASSYQFYIGNGPVNLQRVQPRVGMTPLGGAMVPSLINDNKVHLDFRVNRDKATFAFLVNGVLVQEWQDQGGFLATGSGIAFYSQRTGSEVRIRNMRISQWDGRMDIIRPAPTNAVTETVVSLVNDDRAKGEVKSIGDGKVVITSPRGTFPVPMARVTEILMAQPKDGATNAASNSIQAQFAGGGKVTLTVARWDTESVEGSSPLFGTIKLKPEWIRQIQFNLHRSINDAAELGLLNDGLKGDGEPNE